MALNGIDIASWQAGIDLARVPCDFVIVKATEGTGYVSPTWNAQINDAARAGKLLGAYHYARGGTATTEANHFLATFNPWRGKAIPVLDWESGDNTAWGDGTWVRAWVERVHKRTGVWPLVYVQSSAINQIPEDVRKNCGLWVAQYPDYKPTGYQSTPWNEGTYSCAMRQYTSSGRLDGWNGNLDLNKFYGDRSTWQRYATGGKTTTTSKPTTNTSLIEGVISDMKATHILFQYNGGICIANILAGTWRAFKTPQDQTDTINMLKQAGAKVVEWGALRGKPGQNKVENSAAFGIRIDK
ncbi:GH25 family lysozyme [Bifidobacterium biavatii]|nr:GH25 family lysozyme [Bifidobacterium biavatii]